MRFRLGASGACAIVALFALLATLVALGPSAKADTFESHDSVVSIDASNITPEVLDGQVEAIAVVGDTVVVGGNFTQVREPGGPTLNLPYLFAFSRTTGQIDTNFDPVLNKQVYSLAPGNDGASVYVGGAFTAVNGLTNKKGLTKLDMAGDRVTAFAGRTNGRVKDLVLVNDVLYIGGTFTRVISTDVEKLAAVDATTGQLLPQIDFDFADEFSTSTTTGTLSVDKLDVTADGATLVVVGNFGTVNGLDRDRLMVVDTSTSPAFVSNWSTDLYSVQCKAKKWPQYIRDVDIAPDGSYFVTVSSGAYTDGNPACDTAVRLELTPAAPNIEPTWVQYSGGDTFYGVAVSGEAIYVGGHMRWLNNPFEGDARGPGAVDRRGLAALDPLNGLPLSWRSDRSPRGVGTYDLLLEPDGLWIGDDTDFLNSEFRPRLKFLPLAGGAPIPRPEKPVLPTTVFNTAIAGVDAATFDGTTFGAPLEVLAGATPRGMLFLSGAMFYGESDGQMYVRGFDGTTFGDRVQVDRHGLTSAEFHVARLNGMFFDHDRGRLYYTMNDDTRLLYRYFTPESEVLGAETFVAEPTTIVPWLDIRGMDRIDDQLYYGLADGTLHRVDLLDVTPVAGTDVVLSGPAIDGRDWSGRGMSFFAAGDLFGPPPTLAEFEFASSGSESSGSWQTFDFPVPAGEEVTVKLEWDDPTADVNVFLRDESGTTVTSDGSPSGSPKWLSATAASTGTWSVAVKIKTGTTDYTALVNPVEDPPAPNADHEFNSSGSETSGSWQVFDFPVTAGDPLTIQLDWIDPAAQLNVFLRDETGTTVASDTTVTGSPKILTTTAATGGTWSVAVKIKTGTTDYTVLVNPI